MTSKELYERIVAWEADAGESFTDYFMHDNVADNSWAFWLLGKGFVEKANEIIAEILQGNKCIDQDLLYEVHPNEHELNAQLWADFLASTPYYSSKVKEFFQSS